MVLRKYLHVALFIVCSIPSVVSTFLRVALASIRGRGMRALPTQSLERLNDLRVLVKGPLRQVTHRMHHVNLTCVRFQVLHDEFLTAMRAR